MAKFAALAVQDAPLDVIATATELYFCNGQPANRAAAISTKCHAAAIVMAGGDFVKTGSTDRILTVGAKSVAANASQTVDHVALCSATTLLYVTTAPTQTSNSGAAVDGTAFTITASALV